MFTRRLFLGSLVTALASSRLPASFFIKPYRIGLSETMLPVQADDGLKTSMCGTFEIKGRPHCEIESGSVTEMLKKLAQNDLHLTVVNGVEYAWHREHYEAATPLVAAFTTGVKMKAVLVAPAESAIKRVSDLRGKRVALPERLPQHAFLFLQHALQQSGTQPQGFLGHTTTPVNSEEGIESVIDRNSDAILLDGDAWKAYQERKPARSRKLQVIAQSAAFPTPVVLYHREHANKVEMLALRAALCLAHQKAYSRQLLNFWGISKFVLCGREYETTVARILKELPKPLHPAMMVARQ
jgi:ABC-type phosphate/phosphonate transport system substrate-binding protein